LDFTLLEVHSRGTQAMMVPTFEGRDGMNAAVRFFDITLADAEYLFDPDCYRKTPTGADGELQVADRVKAFIVGDIDLDHHHDYRNGINDDYFNDDED
jgi:hypothetical protein